MNKIRAQLLSLVALSLLVLSIIALAHFKTTAQQAIKPNALISDPVLTEIAKYRQWTRANEKPVVVLDPTSVGA